MPRSAGGLNALTYVLRKSRESGGLLKMARALASDNACKTCGLGMRGMKNELGRFPSVCKKSVQAMAADMQGAISPAFFARYSLEQLRSLSSRELEAMGRLNDPVYAGPGDTHYRTISWDEALARVAERLRATSPERSFYYLSGRSSNEAGFLLQLFARLQGSNHVNNCSYYCHQASGVGLSQSVGSSTATLTLNDVEQADLLFILGANPASNHPRLLHTLVHIKRQGGKVVVVNPLKELGLVNFRVPSDARSLLFGTPIADHYLQPHIGGDIALLAGIAKALVEAGAEDRAFLEQHCNGWPELRDWLAGLDWDSLVAAAGIELAAMRDMAAIYARSDKTVFCWAMGMTHHAHGVDNVRMIANLALLRGMVGKPGAGLMPLRGHSNIQGMGSVGTAPELKPAMLARLEQEFGVSLPRTVGFDTMRCMEAGARGDMDFGFCLGGNLYGSNPDAAFAGQALGTIGCMLYLNTTLNTGHVHGRGRETLILPVQARDEEAQATTQESMFNRVRLSAGGPQRLDGPHSEVGIIVDVACQVLNPQLAADFARYTDHAAIRELIAATVPGYGAISTIESQREFDVAGRIYHTPNFSTADGQAHLHRMAVPGRPPLAADQLLMMTIRSEGQFNTVVYEEEDLYRNQERRDVVLLNPADRQRLGLAINQRVVLSTEVGSLRLLVREFDIRAGNCAIYYPEANALIPRRLDPDSGTPAFKSVVVTIAAS